MASELLKNRALIQKLKEPDVPRVKFNLASTGFEELFTLPESKPQELLDIQEENRKGRLLDSLNKIGGGLMDESVDFIERENFATKGIPGRGVDYFTDRITDPTRLKFLDEAAKRRGYESWSKVPITKQTVPGKRIQGDRERILDEAKRRQEGRPIGKGAPGVPKPVGEDFVSPMKDPEIAARMVATRKKNYQATPVGQRLQWIADNGKNYDNPKDFIKAYEKHFKHKLGSPKDALFGNVGDKGRTVFLANIDNLENAGVQGRDLFYFKKGFSEEELFKASMIQNNPKIKKQFKELFKQVHNNVSEFSELGPESLVERLNKGKLFRDFDLIKFGVGSGITRNSLLNVANVNPEHITSFQNVRKPLRALATIIKNLKNPSFARSYGIGSGTATKIRGQLNNFLKGEKNLTADIKKINKQLGDIKFNQIFGGVNFEHTLAKQFGKDYKYLPRNYLLKGQFTTANFNLFKREVFDLPLIRLMKQYEQGEVSGERVQKFIDDFNAKTNNYADFSFNPQKKKLEYTDNKVKYDLSRYANPSTARDELIKNIELTMSPEFQKGFKGTVGAGNLLEKFKSKDAKEILKLIQSIGCPNNKADGGRIGFQDGTTCFLKGQKAINTGNIKPGAQARNFTKFFNTASSIAKKTGQGLRLFTKFAIIPEAAILGIESAVRMSRGDTLSEALKESISYIPGLGGKAEEADLSRVSRYLSEDDAKYIGNLRNFQKAQQELKNVIGAQEADLALAGTEFDEMSSGESQTDVVERYKPKITEKEKALQEASISQPETLYARSLEDEFEDIKGVKRGKIGRQKRQELNIVDPEDPETESLVTPEITQAELNRRIVGQQPTIAEDIFGDFARATKTPAQQVLDFMRAQEQTAEAVDKAVENVRREQFEKAYEDSALAEQLFGPSRTFAGEPVNLENYEPSDRFQDFEMNRGIYALGGRIGFKDGPKNPGRRAFMKLMAGIASLPILSKFLKPAAPVIEKLANTTTKMPDWFPDFVNKMIFTTGGRRVDADVMEYTTPKLPGVKMLKRDDGEIIVEGKNAYNEPYEIIYRPPGYELVDETTGKAVKIPGEFKASDTQFRRTGPEMDDFDVDFETVEDVDDILGGNATKLEGFAKGTNKEKYTKGQKAIDEAELAGERADEFSPYGDVDPTDFYED